MTDSKNGGPAFPAYSLEMNRADNGMSMREWYAGQALAGLCANSRFNATRQMKEVSEASVEMADEMIKALRAPT